MRAAMHAVADERVRDALSWSGSAQNEVNGHPLPERFGGSTIADVWTFLRGKLDGPHARPRMTVLSSREYAETTEAEAILGILEAIVSRYQP